MTAPELKPCPFCGRAMEITDDLRHYNHPVSACFGRHISIAASDIDRIEMWNRRADLAAAQPAQVRVKPLVWEDGKISNQSLRQVADTFFGTYEALQWSSGDFGGSVPVAGEQNKEFGGLPGIEAAKAAAQADYEARILAALEPQPDPRDEVIARLVDALSMAQLWLDYAGAYDMQGINAALAAAKAVQYD